MREKQYLCIVPSNPSNYVVKLRELCRQTPRIMSSNYSQYRNKKNRAKNNETFLQQIRTSNDGWCLLQHLLSLSQNPKKSLRSDGTEHLCQETTSQRCQRHLRWLLLRFISHPQIFRFRKNTKRTKKTKTDIFEDFGVRKSSNLVNALLKCSNFALWKGKPYLASPHWGGTQKA